MFRLKHFCLDTMREHVVLVHEEAVRTGRGLRGTVVSRDEIGRAHV